MRSHPEWVELCGFILSPVSTRTFWWIFMLDLSRPLTSSLHSILDSICLGRSLYPDGWTAFTPSCKNEKLDSTFERQYDEVVTSKSFRIKLHGLYSQLCYLITA